MLAPLLVLGGAGMGTGLFIALYLDVRRKALIDLGVIPATTPEIFGWKAWQLTVELEYIFSRDFAEHPDAGTRRWVLPLRVSLGAGMIGTLGSFAATFLPF